MRVSPTSGVWIASFGAAAMIAHQVAAKATRDAFYLSNYDVTTLPAMLIAAAVVSIVVVLASSQLMPRLGPVRFVSWTFVGSAVLLLAQWELARRVPGVAAVTFFLHCAAFGAVLISGFWSTVNEHFEPRSAKRFITWIAAASTLGGLVGGLAARVASVHLELVSILPVLAVAHVVCALAVMWLPPLPSPAGRGSPEPSRESGPGVLARNSYLRTLAALVLTCTIATVLLDYVFKARAAAACPDEESLLGFFALFYTCLSVATFLVQILAGRFVLERFGLTRATATFPAALALGGLGALMVPGLIPMAVARGAGAVLRSSLYRSGYELLFAPIPKREKRSTKMIIDVGFDRLGDTVGAGLVLLLLLLGARAEPAILFGVALLGMEAVVLALYLKRGYVETLERNLVQRAVGLDDEEFKDRSNQRAILETMGMPDLDALRTRVENITRLQRGPQPVEPAPPPDPDAIQRLGELHSEDPHRVREALSPTDPLGPDLVPRAITLLGWDPAARAAATALRSVASSSLGQLADALLDADQPFPVRRRIPLVLADVPGPRTVDALLRGLDDPQFTVRFRCGRALARLRERAAEWAVDEERVMAAVIREVSVDRSLWDGRREFQSVEEIHEPSFVDGAIADRVHRGLEHVFTLLSLVLEREPLSVAFRGLHTDDPGLRGTALEYLECVLPASVREPLWPFIEGAPAPATTPRPRKQVVDQLMQSHQSIEMNLESLKGRRGG